MKIRVNNSIYSVKELSETGAYTEGNVHYDNRNFEVVDWGNFYELAKECKDPDDNCPCWFDFKLYEITKGKETNNNKKEVTMKIRITNGDTPLYDTVHEVTDKDMRDMSVYIKESDYPIHAGDYEVVSVDEQDLADDIEYHFPEGRSFWGILNEMGETYERKNHDYGNSFDTTLDEFGLVAAVVRMNDKMMRLKQLLKKDAKVKESMRDTLMDLANYSAMTAMYIDNHKDNKDD